MKTSKLAGGRLTVKDLITLSAYEAMKGGAK